MYCLFVSNDLARLTVSNKSCFSAHVFFVCGLPYVSLFFIHEENDFKMFVHV